MKDIIAKIDNIASYIESFDEPWCHLIVANLDDISQTLKEIEIVDPSIKKLAGVNRGILNQYLNKILFLDKNSNKLTTLIQDHNGRKAADIYKLLKGHFSKLSRQEAVDFIKNVLKNIK